MTSALPQVRALGLAFALLAGATAIGSCGSSYTSVQGAPRTPPDVAYRTGVEVGDDVMIWVCEDGDKVVMHRRSSAFCGSSMWSVHRRACGTTSKWDLVPDRERYELPADNGLPSGIPTR